MAKLDVVHSQELGRRRPLNFNLVRHCTRQQSIIEYFRPIVYFTSSNLSRPLQFFLQSPTPSPCPISCPSSSPGASPHASLDAMAPTMRLSPHPKVLPFARKRPQLRPKETDKPSFTSRASPTSRARAPSWGQQPPFALCWRLPSLLRCAMAIQLREPADLYDRSWSSLTQTSRDLKSRTSRLPAFLWNSLS